MERSQVLLEQAASGRRIVNLCLFAWLAATAFHIDRTPLFAVFFLAYTVAAIFGTLRLTKGLSVGGMKRVFLVSCSAIPIIGLLVMILLGTRASKSLRSAGYQVGMFLSSRAAKPNPSIERTVSGKPETAAHVER